METRCGPRKIVRSKLLAVTGLSRRQAARLEAHQPHPIAAADYHVLVLAAQHAPQQLAEEGELRQRDINGQQIVTEFSGALARVKGARPRAKPWTSWGLLADIENDDGRARSAPGELAGARRLPRLPPRWRREPQSGRTPVGRNHPPSPATPAAPARGSSNWLPCPTPRLAAVLCRRAAGRRRRRAWTRLRRCGRNPAAARPPDRRRALSRVGARLSCVDPA